MSPVVVKDCPDFFIVGMVGSSFINPIAEYFSATCGGIATHLHVYQRGKWDGNVPSTVETISFEEDAQE